MPPPSTTAPARRFTLLDGMIGVAATAVALPGTRRLWEALEGPVADLPVEIAGGVARGMIREVGAVLLILSVPAAAAWTVALIPLRMKRPRPPRRRLVRQPGLVATVAASITLATSGLVAAAVGAMGNRAPGGNSFFWLNDRPTSYLVLVPGLAGAAVLGSWLTLIVGGRWRAEPSWPDRLGRLLGLYWIALAVGGAAAVGFALG